MQWRLLFPQQSLCQWLTLVPLTVSLTAHMDLWSWVKGSSSKFWTHAFHSNIVIKNTVRDGGERGGRRDRYFPFPFQLMLIIFLLHVPKTPAQRPVAASVHMEVLWKGQPVCSHAQRRIVAELWNYEIRINQSAPFNSMMLMLGMIFQSYKFPLQ